MSLDSTNTISGTTSLSLGIQGYVLSPCTSYTLNLTATRQAISVSSTLVVKTTCVITGEMLYAIYCSLQRYQTSL